MAFESLILLNAISGVTTLELVGITAGVIQLIAYFDYYRKVVRGEVDPSPLSWLMFMYGTIFLLILEIDAGASFAVLALPAACSFGSLTIAANIWNKSYRATGKVWPKEWRLKDDSDGKSFRLDLTLTACYLLAGALASVNLWDVLGFQPPLSEESRHVATIWVLILSNLSTFPGFGPLIRNTKLNPSAEYWRPWALWTLAYTLTMCVTWVDTDVSRIPESMNPFVWGVDYWEWLALMFYPVSCAYLHARISWLARPDRQKFN